MTYVTEYAATVSLHALLKDDRESTALNMVTLARRIGDVDVVSDRKDGGMAAVRYSDGEWEIR